MEQIKLVQSAFVGIVLQRRVTGDSRERWHRLRTAWIGHAVTCLRPWDWATLGCLSECRQSIRNVSSLTIHLHIYDCVRACVRACVPRASTNWRFFKNGDFGTSVEVQAEYELDCQCTETLKRTDQYYGRCVIKMRHSGVQFDMLWCVIKMRRSGVQFDMLWCFQDVYASHEIDVR